MPIKYVPYLDFYSGFEGECELIITRQGTGGTRQLRIWEGYFSDLTDTIEPEASGWTGLALYYHLDTG